MGIQGVIQGRRGDIPPIYMAPILSLKFAFRYQIYIYSYDFDLFFSKCFWLLRMHALFPPSTSKSCMTPSGYSECMINTKINVQKFFFHILVLVTYFTMIRLGKYTVNKHTCMHSGHNCRVLIICIATTVQTLGNLVTLGLYGDSAVWPE